MTRPTPTAASLHGGRSQLAGPRRNKRANRVWSLAPGHWPWIRHSGFELRAFALPLLALACLLAPGCDEDTPPAHIEAELAGQPFKLELCLTEPQRRRGMMGRSSLGRNEGMLFVFPGEQRRRFWMKNCKIPLDVVYLDADGRIVSIRTMSVPDPDTPDHEIRRYSSRWPARFAIELRAGRAEALGLAEGDRLDLPLQRLKAHAR